MGCVHLEALSLAKISLTKRQQSSAKRGARYSWAYLYLQLDHTLDHDSCYEGGGRGGGNRSSLWRLWSVCPLPWLLTSLYRLKEVSQWTLGRSLWSRRGLGMNRAKSVKIRICSRGFRRLEPAVRVHGTAGPDRTNARQTFRYFRYFGRHFLIRTSI
jgi:hypothetical protein